MAGIDVARRRAREQVTIVSREPNRAERYLLTHYQHLMEPAERMVARSLVAADFDLTAIPKTVWARVWQEFPGISQADPWKLPLRISTRLLHEHRDEISIPHEHLQR